MAEVFRFISLCVQNISTNPYISVTVFPRAIFSYKIRIISRKKILKCGKNDSFYHVKSNFLFNGEQENIWKNHIHFLTNSKMVKFYCRVDIYPQMQFLFSLLTWTIIDYFKITLGTWIKRGRLLLLEFIVQKKSTKSGFKKK